MGTAGRTRRMTQVLAAMERWSWRVIISLLVLGALVAVFLLVGSGTGGSGSP
jgi:hypothetical protein